MQTVTLEQAQKRLAQLVRDLSSQGDVVITEGNQPVARLVPANPAPSLRDIKPRSVGEVLRPFPCTEDDLLGEMSDIAMIGADTRRRRDGINFQCI